MEAETVFEMDDNFEELAKISDVERVS